METTQAVRALSALAQATRLEIFRLLVRSGDEGLPAGQIAEQIGVPAATASFHLKELLNSGLINQERQSRSLIYRLEVQSMRELLAYLAEECCEGRPELCELSPPQKRSTSC